MNSISSIVARGSALLHTRDDSTSTPMSSTVIDLLIALLVLVFVALILVGALFLVRSVRRRRAIERQQLPLYNNNEKRSSHQHHRRLTITTTPYGRGSSIYVYDEKSSMINGGAASPTSPDAVPEIRITFPDEQDESGRPKSGRVVVVRVGETGVGLEPLDDEQLPAYEKETGGARFHSIDMERIGGLKEKSMWS